MNIELTWESTEEDCKDVERPKDDYYTIYPQKQS